MRLGIAAVAAALGVLALPAIASAQQTIEVNTTTENEVESCTPEPGGCTLREALNNATPSDVVSVPSGTYVLEFGELVVNSDTTVVGAGARTTIIDGEGATRVLLVEAGNLAISGATITGGNGQSQVEQGQGGGIRVSSGAGLTLTSIAVVENVVTGFGGGISNSGNMTIFDSTISGNEVVGSSTVGQGGGIHGTGSTSLMNATVSGNSSDGPGGGVYVVGAFQTQKVTIANNQAGAAGGGGVFNAGTTMIMLDTIVAGNTPGGCAGNATIGFGDHNLSSDASCGFVGDGDQSNVDPRLGPLEDNGGSTNTHALLAGSPAIDAASPPDCSGADQRGVIRPQGAACDIGAFEYAAGPPPPPPPPPPPLPPGPPPPPRETDQLPPPVAGKTVNVLPSSGTVRIKLPGSNRFVGLEEGQQVPVGTVIDARKGRVTLVAAADKNGDTSTAVFYDGIFKLGQTKGAKPVTTLELVEKLSCGKGSGKASAAAKKKKKRQLWGDGKGRFRTEGDYSSATVRGTKWLTLDRCDSTLTRVVRGKVSVRDFVKRKTVTVRAGKQYIARRRR